MKKTKKIFLGIAFVFVFAIGAVYSLKNNIFKQEVKKTPGVDSAAKSDGTVVVAQEEICDEENDEYLFVGCNGFF